MPTLKTFSSEETKSLGEELAQKVLDLPQGPRAIIISLTGNLGAGKTTFVQGFMRGLGLKKRTASPTFIIFRRFALRHARYKNVYHVDVYRIKKPEELHMLEFDKIFANPKNIVLIEWPENIKKLLPKKGIRLQFKHGVKENERSITLK